MRVLPMWPLTILVLIELVAAFEFGYAPQCARPVLYKTAPEKCDHGTNYTATNTCLCADSSWLKDASRLIYKDCNCPTVVGFATFVLSVCNYYNITPVLTPEQITAAGDCKYRGSVTPSDVPSSNSTMNSGDGGSDSSNKIAIGVGIGIGIPSLAVATVGVWFQFIRGRKKK